MTSSLLFNITTIAYLISMLVFFTFLASRTKAVGTAAMLVAYAGLLAQSVAIGLRWKESYDMGMGHAPLSNLYESGLFMPRSSMPVLPKGGSANAPPGFQSSALLPRYSAIWASICSCRDFTVTVADKNRALGKGLFYFASITKT